MLTVVGATDLYNIVYIIEIFYLQNYNADSALLKDETLVRKSIGVWRFHPIS